MTSFRFVPFLLVWHLTFCGAATAKDPPDPWPDARFHFGAIAVSPVISMANLGIDTNVFASSEKPQRDFTVTVTPLATAIVRVGRARVTGQGAAVYQYFDKFVSERSLSTRGSAQIVAPFSWLQLTGGALTVNSRQREGAEITARVRRYQTAMNAGASVRLSGVLHLGVEAERTRYTFPKQEEFLGTNLRRVLE